jgi:hypothetical protein
MTETEDGDEIELRAYVHQVTRGLVILEWDLTDKVAMIQVTELPSGNRYEDVRDEFLDSLRTWLDVSSFQELNLSKAIAALHRSEENDEKEVRSHGIEYQTIEGRRLAGKSPSTTNSVLGEEVIDESLQRIRDEGTGHIGNFYFLPPETTDHDDAEDEELGDALTHEIHAVILGDKQRVSLRTRSAAYVSENEMRHVLSRMRAISA